jgi:hypothetical protein
MRRSQDEADRDRHADGERRGRDPDWNQHVIAKDRRSGQGAE